MIGLRRFNVFWLVLLLLIGTGYQVTAQEPPVNQLPLVVSIAPQELEVGQTLTLSVGATDPDGDILVLTAASDNGDVLLAAADPNAQLVVTLTGVGAGNAAITVTVDDGRGGVTSTSFPVTVTAPPPPPPVNQLPLISSLPGLSVETGQTVIVPLSFSDPDGDALSITPVSSDVNVATVVFAPPSALSVTGLNVGSALIAVTIDDGRGGTSATSFAITVTAAAPSNQSPVIALVNAQSLPLGQTASVPLAYSDPDGDTVTLTVTSDNPTVATVIQSSAFELTISALAVGTANVSVQADDGRGGSTAILFAVSVNAPLVLTGNPTVASDKLDYAPGEWVTLTGTNWQGDTQVRIIVNDDYGSTWRRDTLVAVAADGTITDTFWLPSWFVANYSIVVSGQQTGRVATGSFTDSSVGTYDQCSNDQGTGYANGDTGCRWINGNLQSNNSRYFEGDATVQRVWFTDFAPGSSHTVTLVYGTTKGGKHAYDFLTTWDWSEDWIAEADRCQGIAGCVGTAESRFDIPQDPNVPNSFEPSAPGDRQFVMRGGSITAVSTPVIVSGSYAGDSETALTITFTVANSGQMCSGNCSVALWFGAHVAAQANWGLGLGAGSISGSPYHVALDRVDNASVGQRDNQMQAGAVTIVPNGTIVIVKDTAPNNAQDFSFNLTNNSTITQNFSLDDDADPTLPNSQTFSVPPGIWTASELNMPLGWTLTNLVCVDPTGNTTVSGATATINLASSETVICTYTNSQQQGTLRVIKNLINNNGGTAGFSSFSFSVNPGISYTFDADGQIDISVSPGTYTVTEFSTPGYSTSYNNCTNVIVPAGGLATCTITNDDIAPTLTLIKTVINNSGGTAQATDWTLSATGPTPLSGTGTVTSGAGFSVGTYALSETGPTGYTSSAWSCTGGTQSGSSITLALGQSATCAITNDDQPGTLIVKKVVINDNGGTLTASAFSFSVNGGTALAFETDGQNDLTVNAGMYSIVEPAVTGYTTTYDNCSDVNIPLGGTATCTITNNDQPGTLIVKKVVINDNGGLLTASAFSFSVNDAAAIAFETDGQNDLTVNAGTYSILEPAVTGYTTTYDNCTNVAIPLGGMATCTITNNDQPGTLIVKKIVINDNGGTLTASAFTFSVNGAAPVPFEGDGQNDLTVNAGTYSIVEPAVTGYTTTYDNCTNAAVPLGGTATCTITNDDQPGTIIVEKQTDPVGLAGNFQFTGDASGTISDGGQIIVSGLSAGPYMSTELVPDGWQLTGIVCSDSNSTGSVSSATATFQIENGETVRCTFTNDPLPTVMLVKSALPATLAEPGGAFTFTVRVINTSAEPVTITDFNDTQTTACDYLIDDVLDVGAAVTCTYTITHTDAGTYLNTASVTVTDNEGNIASDEDSETVTVTDALPMVTLTKTADPVSRPEPGGVFIFTVTITNTSVESVTITAFNDTQTTACDSLIGQQLVVGASITCTYTIAHTDAGSYDNTASVTVADNEGNSASDSDDETVTVTDVLPTIALTKAAEPTTLPEPGGNFEFTVTITNTSVEPVTITVFDDSQTAACDYLIGETLAVGASITCTYTVTHINAGTYLNNALVIVEDNEENTASASDNESVTVTDVAPRITVEKTAAPTSVPETGGDVEFTFTVTNNSVEPVTITDLSDSVYGTLTGDADCQIHSILAVGASCSFIITQWVEGDYSGPDHVNVFTATATDNENNSASDEDDATVDFTNVLPTIEVTKTANPTAVPETGGSVTFTFVVLNASSEESVTITSLTDSVYGSLTGDADCQVGTNLAAAASCEFAITQWVEGDFSGPDHVNVFTAQAVDNDNTEATDDDDATVDFTNVLPTIEVTKTANPTAVPETGGSVTFTFTVKNTSSEESVTITSLTDNVYGTLAGDADCAVHTVLAADASCMFAITRWVEGDYSGPDHVNVFTAQAVDNDNTEATDDDDATVDFTNVPPTIEVTKTANPTAVPETGGSVTLTFVVLNTSSEEPVTITSLSDSVYGSLTGDANCQIGTSIAAGASCTFSIIRWVEGDFSGPDHVNVFTAHAQDNDGTDTSDTDDATVDFTNVLPTIEVTKTENPTAVPETGGSVTFTFVVLNTSVEEPVTITSLSDSVYGTLAGDSDCAVNTVLAAGASCTFAITRWVEGDYSGPDHINVFTAKALDNDNTEATDDDDATVDFTNVLPTIEVTKTADPTAVPETGGGVTFTFVVLNTSSEEPVTITSLSDSVYGTLAGDSDCAVHTVLAAGATCNFSITRWVEGDFSGPDHVNVFTAQAEDNDGTDASDTDDATVDFTNVLPTIEVTKTANPTAVPETGGSVTFTFVVLNTSSEEPVTIISLSDSMYGTLAGDAGCQVGTSLAAGASCEFAITHWVEGDFSAPDHVNVFTAHAQDNDGTNASDTDDATVDFTNVLPTIEVTKTADPTAVPETGGSVTFTFVVLNTSSEEPVTITSLIDTVYGTLTGDADCAVGTVLDAGASCEFAISRWVQGDFESDVAHHNIFTAIGEDNDGAEATDDDDATVNFTNVTADITIVKVTVDGSTSSDGLNILTGEAIKWRYMVTNAGNYPLSGVTVTDSQSGVTPTYVSGDTNGNGKLDLTETWVYEAAGTAVTGSYSNTGTAYGEFVDGAGIIENDSASDGSSYFGANPQMAITKVTVDGSISGDGLNILTGEAIKWRYTVTNSGNVALSSVTVTDDQSGVTPAYVSGDANSNGKLDLTETWVFEAIGTAVTGNYSNTGTTSGSFTDSAGHQRTDTVTDTSSYFGANPQIDIVKKTVGSDGSESDNVFVLAGADVRWNYYVTNTGNVTLSSVLVTDDHGVVVNCPKTSLAAGEAMTCTATGSNTTVFGTLYNNTGTANGTYTDDAGHSRTATDSDSSSYYSQNPGVVTNSSLCDFGTNFTLVFTPDVRNYTSSLQAYKLSDSNPGQFFYNVFQTGGTGSVTLTLPYPFVTQGATPIHVYRSLTVSTVSGQNCLVPTNEIKNYQTQVTLSSYPANTYSGTTTVTLTGLPTSGFIYINIHLDYGLEKLNGWVKNNSNANYNLTINPTIPHVNIINNSAHTFTSTVPNSTDSISNQNEFKRVRGFGGIASIRTGVVDGITQYESLTNARVELRNPTGTTLEVMYTDANGWYLSNYIHNGKAATYTVRVTGGSTVIGGASYVYGTTGWQSVSVGGSNKFGEANFQITPSP